MPLRPYLCSSVASVDKTWIESSTRGGWQLSEPVRLAFVGCGGISGAHVKGYQQLHEGGCRDFEYVACCDPNEEGAQGRAKELAEIQGTEPQVFTGVDELIKSGVCDAVDICSPHWLHHSLAIQCLEGGLHVMVEKPIGISIKATKRIIEAGEKTGLKVATAENIRRYQTARAFKWAVSEKKMVGDLYKVETLQSAYNPMNQERYAAKWRAIKLLSGGGLLSDSGAHYADMMVHLFGEVDQAYCRTFNYQGVEIPDAPIVGTVNADVEEVWHALIRFKNGVEATWAFSRVFHPPAVQYAHYYGPEGTILNDRVCFHPFQTGGTVYLKDGTEYSSEQVIADYLATLSDDEKNLLFPYGCTDGFGVQTWDFCDAIQSDRKPEMDGTDGLKSKGLCWTCYESAEADALVKYDDVLSGAVSAYQDPVDEYWGI